jgi:hypothetical protein
MDLRSRSPLPGVASLDVSVTMCPDIRDIYCVAKIEVYGRIANNFH